MKGEPRGRTKGTRCLSYPALMRGVFGGGVRPGAAFRSTTHYTSNVLPL